MLNAAAVLPLNLRLTCVNISTQPLSSQGESENEFTFLNALHLYGGNKSIYGRRTDT